MENSEFVPMMEASWNHPNCPKVDEMKSWFRQYVKTNDRVGTVLAGARVPLKSILTTMIREHQYKK